VEINKIYNLFLFLNLFIIIYCDMLMDFFYIYVDEIAGHIFLLMDFLIDFCYFCSKTLCYIFFCVGHIFIYTYVNLMC
jgi:hypothetical protein